MIITSVMSLAFLANLHIPQATPQPPPPIITTVATGEVRLPPELALAVFGVDVRESTAAAAARRMGDALTRVIDTLVALGIPRDSLPSTEYVVAPTYDYETERPSGFEATGSIRVTITDLLRLSTFVQAALAAGANNISSLEFRVRTTRAARDEALRRAVADARRDAEVLAVAAGGALGGLVDMSLGGSSPFRGTMSLDEIVVQGGRGVRGATSVPIVPREVRVEVTVTTRWQFVAAPR